MTGVQVSLFRALQSIKIEDDKATAVVDTLEGFIAMQVSQATAPILAKLDAIDARLTSADAAEKARFDSLASTEKARFDSLAGSIANQKWVFSAVIATVGIVFSLLNYFHAHS